MARCRASERLLGGRHAAPGGWAMTHANDARQQRSEEKSLNRRHLVALIARMGLTALVVGVPGVGVIRSAFAACGDPIGGGPEREGDAECAQHAGDGDCGGSCGEEAGGWHKDDLCGASQTETDDRCHNPFAGTGVTFLDDDCHFAEDKDCATLNSPGGTGTEDRDCGESRCETVVSRDDDCGSSESGGTTRTVDDDTGSQPGGENNTVSQDARCGQTTEDGLVFYVDGDCAVVADPGGWVSRDDDCRKVHHEQTEPDDDCNLPAGGYVHDDGPIA